MNSQFSESVVFGEIREQVSQLTTNVIDQTLSKRVYNPKEVQQWVNLVSDEIIKKLTEQNKNFKFMVTCIIM